MKRVQEEPVVGDNEESRKKQRIETVPSDLAEKIKKQVEFYFGDSNYPRDRFMKETAEKNDGWIPFPTLFLFKRLASLTTDAQVVVDACKDSTIVVFDEEKTKIKRAVPVPEEVAQTFKQRSVDVVHLPEGVTIESVEAFFGTYGKVLSVRLRLRQGSVYTFFPFSSTEFAGTARVEFDTEEAAKKVLEAGELTWATGEKLKTFSAASDKPKKEKKQTDNKKQQQPKNAEPTYSPGTVLRLNNLPAGADRHELKFGKVLYIDTSSFAGKSLVRFLEPAGTQEALKEIEAKSVEFAGTVLEGEPMPAAEEEEYWKTHVLPGLQSKARSGKSGRGRGRR